MTDVSPEVFAVWREPRFGTANPTRLDNPLWASLVLEEPRANAYQIAKRFGYEREMGAPPTWCFDRYGRTTTELSDGRVVHVAGEHEDYYDPDFFIYNDVVVVAPGGEVAFYGYPRDAFPQTDFHTATLHGDTLWLVGSLGYAPRRKRGITQVCRLDLTTFAIEKLATSGDAPGWIHEHTAEPEGRSIVVRGGKVQGERGAPLEENIDDWALDLETLVWTRRTARDWQRWAVRRTDDKSGQIWELRQLAWHVAHPSSPSGVDYREGLQRDLGFIPDLAHLDALYLHDGAELLQQRDNEYNVWRIVLDGVTVRFTEERARIAVMVEGRLSEERLRALQQHVLGHVEALHGTPWQLDER